MEITLAQKDLEDAVVLVSGLVERTATSMPIIANIFMEADSKGVQLRGTDNEALVTANLVATVTQPGSTTVPAETLRDIVRLLPPNSEVRLIEKGGRIAIHCESNDYKLMTIPAENFPQWPAETGQTKFQLSQKTLKHLIDSTTYALPQKDHRRVLLGVYFELKDNTLRLTATDGKKLARISTNVPEVEGVGTAAMIVPRKLLENLMKALSGEGPVEVEMSPKQIAFRFENLTYRCNGIEGKYPDCDAVIPKDFPTRIDLNRDAFLVATKRAGIVSEEKNKSIILKFDEGRCEFQSMAHDLGAFSGKLNIDYSGMPLEIAFNYQFLIETLGRFSNAAVQMHLRNATQPVVFKSEDDPDRLALLMPVKLAELRPVPVGGDDEEEAEEENY